MFPFSYIRNFLNKLMMPFSGSFCPYGTDKQINDGFPGNSLPGN
ncbi:Uncharacterized protein dnm_096640 [Desulfonema magnum]|uniref:Uncharacterized protein n=1 Tax=Desulfonema magnum TaxID=45655 RepID=A0A975BYA9_9BACT|nr:Uncharacterized protein dnm_096640 [Desulfonema magnum]